MIHRWSTVKYRARVGSNNTCTTRYKIEDNESRLFVEGLTVYSHSTDTVYRKERIKFGSRTKKKF